MKQAETYLEMVADCPYCGESNTTEWVEIYETECYEWPCENCGEKFEYAHPENAYGLSK